MKLVEKMDPKQWGQYFGNKKQVSVLKDAIKDNNFPPAILMSGTSGTGKTSLAKLFIRSVLCPNRKPGEYVPCGKCKSCKSDPKLVGTEGNVIWVQQGAKDSITTQFNYAIGEAFKATNGVADEHNDYKFVVIDELQDIPSNLMNRLLYTAELEEMRRVNKVIFIYITMQEEAVKGNFKALADRSLYLKFKPFESKYIFGFLRKYRPKAPPESLRAIAKDANGSLRAAISRLDLCEDYDSTLDIISVHDILEFADTKSRALLWDKIRLGNYRDTFDYWRVLTSRVSEKDLLSAMADDLITEMTIAPSEELNRALMEVYTHQVSKANVRAFSLLTILMKRNLIDTTRMRALAKEETGYDFLFKK